MKKRSMRVRTGAGTRKSVQVGYCLSNKLEIRSDKGPDKRIPEKTCFPGKVVHRHKCLEYECATCKLPNFPLSKIFSASLS